MYINFYLVTKEVGVTFYIEFHALPDTDNGYEHITKTSLHFYTIITPYDIIWKLNIKNIEGDSPIVTTNKYTVT